MGEYVVNEEMRERLHTEFTYHPPKDDQVGRYDMLRVTAYKMAVKICELTPPSREQSLALTHLGECIMWANAAIARNE